MKEKFFYFYLICAEVQMFRFRWCKNNLKVTTQIFKIIYVQSSKFIIEEQAFSVILIKHTIKDETKTNKS